MLTMFNRVGFLVGVTAVIVYHTNMVPVLYRTLMEKMDGTTTTTTTTTTSDSFSLRHIDLSTVEENFEEAAKKLVKVS